MAVQHQPLSAQEMGPRVLPLVGPEAPGQMRSLVAQGVAPLEPRDLVVALYQVWVDPELVESELAARTAAALPDAIVDGALAAPDLPPVVLDFLARRCAGRDALLDRIVRHPQALDDTLVAVARHCGPVPCETLADNQQRWLACPDIICSLYVNRNCRQSQIRRMLELADNQGLELNLPVIEEVRATMAAEREAGEDGGDDAERDAMIQACVAVSAEQEAAEIEAELAVELPQAAGAETSAPAPKVPEAKDMPRNSQTLRGLRPSEKIRIALLGNKTDRAVLVRDTNKSVAMATIKSPRLRDSEVVGFSADRSLSNDVVRYITTRRDWVKLYAIKFNLVMNPKTPLAKAMALLAHLGRKDVQKVARSRNIPSALAKAAKRRDQGAC